MDNRIVIETLDNPGWSVIIDTNDTSVILSDKEWVIYEKSAEDWYGFKKIDGEFHASGDPTKLNFLLGLFRRFVSEEQHTNFV